MEVNDYEKKRVALVSTHGYVAATPPLGMADTGGQVVYVLELGKNYWDGGVGGQLLAEALGVPHIHTPHS